MEKRFTHQLWEGITPIYQAILRHPFVTGLTDGSLPEERFRFYAVQDALYLRDFAKALAAAAASAPRDEWTEFLSEHARDVLVVERALHDSFFREWDLTPEQVYATPIAPTNLAYTSYLLRVAHGAGFEEAVAALLPCDWIYIEVGRELVKKGSPNPLYQRWIDTYASEEFQAIVQRLIEIVDAVAEGLSESRLEVLRHHFTVASRYEWMFWDMAWRMEAWPL
ncbi:MAG TPA: thiaminase II [Anaerolineae bacterium]|nr:thiaminase II [Anaerolineae bacterium]